MIHHPFILIDRVRAEQFALLGRTRRLFLDHQVWTDSQGIPWAGARCKEMGFAVTCLGPGWVFDQYACDRKPEKLAERREANQQAGVDHWCELAEVLGRLRLGGHSERLLWAIHQHVMAFRRS